MAPPEARPTILFVCTANICRSPMAEAILRRRLTDVGSAIAVSSAGLRPVGGPADARAKQTMAKRGLDLRHHTSKGADLGEITDAALILAMERVHIAQLVALSRSSFAKTFGLTEIVAVGEVIGPRRPGETIQTWVTRAHAGRRPADVLRADPSFDVADPHGGSLAEYERCADELSRLIDSLILLIDGVHRIR